MLFLQLQSCKRLALIICGPWPWYTAHLLNLQEVEVQQLNLQELAARADHHAGFLLVQVQNQKEDVKPGLGVGLIAVKLLRYA
jgi:hypothetical protein